MTIITVDIEQKLTLLREEIIPRLTNDVEKLNIIAVRDYAPGSAEAIRITAKAAAIQKVITEQGERLVNVKTENDVFALVAIIEKVGEFDGAQAQGTRFAANRLYDFIR